MEDNKKVIGNSTLVSFPEVGFSDVPARVDTGARISAIWGSAAMEGSILQVTFFGEGSQLYTGQAHPFEEYEEVVISSSMGHAQKRYKVVLLVKIRGKKVRAAFTIADRSQQVYPVLVGRNVLRGKFVVDVKKGKSLRDEENQKIAGLQSKLKDL